MRRLAAVILALLLPLATGAPWQIGLRRAGPVRYGMTLAEASQALGEHLQPDDGEGEGCTYVSPKSAPPGVNFMVIDGRLERVDVTKEGVSTVSGAHIGSTEEEIKTLYPGRIQVTDHPYDGPEGHYLLYVPRDAPDSSYRIIFETDGHKVLMYRAGLRPAVDYIEGCS